MITETLMKKVRTSCAAVLVAMLAACANEGGPGAAPKAEEIPLSTDEVRALHARTVIDYKMGNGDAGRSVYAGDGTLRTTYMGRQGTDSDSGRVTYKDDGEFCIAWQKWESSCWKYYKVGERYVSHEVGGKQRTVRFTVTPQT